MPRDARSASTGASSAAGELDTLLQQPGADLAPSQQHEEVTTYPLLPQYFYEVRERPTHYMTLEERTRYRLGVSNGQLVAADGSVLGSSAELDGMFVMDAQRAIFASFRGHDERLDYSELRHSSLVSGERVAAAGLLSVRDGRLVSISNESGHYAPLPSSLQCVLGRLAELGAEGLEQTRVHTVHSGDMEALSDAASHATSAAAVDAAIDAACNAADLARVQCRRRIVAAAAASASAAAAATPAPLQEAVDELAPSVMLRAMALKWSRRSFAVLLVPTWLCFTCFTPPPDTASSGLASEVFAPVLFGILTLGFVCSGIAAVPKGSPDGQLEPKHVVKIGSLCCASITLQSVHKISVAHARGWDMEGAIRAAIPGASLLLIYAASAAVYTRRLTPWAAYRVTIITAGVEAIVGCIALRLVVGPSATYPPGNICFGGALACWCEAIACGVLCTPRTRLRILKAWTVVSLREGVHLKTEAGKSRDGSQSGTS